MRADVPGRGLAEIILRAILDPLRFKPNYRTSSCGALRCVAVENLVPQFKSQTAEAKAVSRRLLRRML